MKKCDKSSKQQNFGFSQIKALVCITRNSYVFTLQFMILITEIDHFYGKQFLNNKKLLQYKTSVIDASNFMVGKLFHFLGMFPPVAPQVLVH